MNSFVRSIMRSIPKVEATKCTQVMNGVQHLPKRCYTNISQNVIGLKPLSNTSDIVKRNLHTRGDQELVSFLSKEIAAEKETMVPKLPSHLDSFAVKGDKASITLSKQFHDEEISIKMNVNHSISPESSNQYPEEGQNAELKSRPSFDVDIVANNKTISFTCEFIESSTEQGESQDMDSFGISEVSVYNSEWAEAEYAVSGEVMDEKLYDMLLNYLEERGISEEFVEKMSSLCSDHEHAQYVGLLERMESFMNRK